MDLKLSWISSPFENLMKAEIILFFFFFKYILVNISMLVSLGFYNKVPQSGGLKTTEIYCLMFLEARRQKSGCWQAPFSP